MVLFQLRIHSLICILYCFILGIENEYDKDMLLVSCQMKDTISKYFFQFVIQSGRKMIFFFIHSYKFVNAHILKTILNEHRLHICSYRAYSTDINIGNYIQMTKCREKK